MARAALLIVASILPRCRTMPASFSRRSTAILITVNGVRKAFGDLVAVDDVSFEVRDGENFVDELAESFSYGAAFDPLDDHDFDFFFSPGFRIILGSPGGRRHLKRRPAGFFDQGPPSFNPLLV